jgi:hypothetical protein
MVVPLPVTSQAKPKRGDVERNRRIMVVLDGESD